MNDFDDEVAETAGRIRSELQIDNLREQGGIFVEAVRLTRMPMIVTDARLPGNPIVFANDAFAKLSGYAPEQIAGQDPHFMNGGGTDPDAIARYRAAMDEGRDATVEIVQYRRDGTPFRAMLFASPLTDGQGKVVHHFLSYIDITRRARAEEELHALTGQLESKVAERTRELQEANRVLTELIAEREMLLDEVNHRAKNSLAIASSLLSIQGRRHPDPDVRALFQQARERIMSMARVHDLLSKSESAQRVDLATYLLDLCGALRSITDPDDRIALVGSGEEGILVHSDVAIPLGLIATELITNAVKYAFPPPRRGTIRVATSRRGPDRFELSVSDDGRGMAGGGREGSLGYSLIEALVRQIRAEMEVTSEGGLTVTIVVPAVLPAPAGA